MELPSTVPILSTTTGTRIPSLAPGASVTVTVAITPPPEQELGCDHVRWRGGALGLGQPGVSSPRCVSCSSSTWVVVLGLVARLMHYCITATLRVAHAVRASVIAPPCGATAIRRRCRPVFADVSSLYCAGRDVTPCVAHATRATTFAVCTCLRRFVGKFYVAGNDASVAIDFDLIVASSRAGTLKVRAVLDAVGSQWRVLYCASGT